MYELQGWGIVSLALFYGYLYFGHQINGDYTRKKGNYVPPQVLNDNN
jgi:hypothetical protein